LWGGGGEEKNFNTRVGKGLGSSCRSSKKGKKKEGRSCVSKKKRGET